MTMSKLIDACTRPHHGTCIKVRSVLITDGEGDTHTHYEPNNNSIRP